MKRRTAVLGLLLILLNAGPVHAVVAGLTRVGAGTGAFAEIDLTVEPGSGVTVRPTAQHVIFPPVTLDGATALDCHVFFVSLFSPPVILCVFDIGVVLLVHRGGEQGWAPVSAFDVTPVPASSLGFGGHVLAVHEGDQVRYYEADVLPKPAAPLSAPRAVPPPLSQVVPMPGTAPAFSTQSLAFDPLTERSYVCHGTGISVVDPPYTSVAFTIPLAGCTGIATAPDGSLVAAVNLTRQMFIFSGPLGAGSTPQILNVAPAPARFEGLAFARDGSKIITAALDTPDIYLISPPYGSVSSVQHVTLANAVGGWEDVAVSPDNEFVLAAGAPNLAGRMDPAIPLGRFPFGPGDFTTLAVPGGRGGGSVRFPPELPCPVSGAAAPATSPRVLSDALPRVGTLPLAAAVLPLSRSVRVGCPATAFVSVINAGTETATGVSIAPATSVPAAFLYQTTDATNALTGAPNTPVDIPPGQAQSFLIAFTPTAPFPPTDVAFAITGTNTASAAVLPRVNTFRLAASPGRTGDAIALAVTGTGILDIPGPNGAAAFAVASANVGINSVLTVLGDAGSGSPPAGVAGAAAALPLSVTVCQTEPATGQCLAPPAPSITVPIIAGGTPSFGFFVSASGPVAFDPANNRVFARLLDALGVERGSTSLAVRTLP